MLGDFGKVPMSLGVLQNIPDRSRGVGKFRCTAGNGKMGQEWDELLNKTASPTIAVMPLTG